MMFRTALALVTVVGASGCLAAALAPRAEGVATPARPLLVLTGRDSEIVEPRFRIVRAQETFDREWIEHLGPRVPRAAQGWPMTPTIDFDACDAVLIFGGASTNANGYRVLDVIDRADAVVVRYERISYQTVSLDGRDGGDPVRPWAMLLLPAASKPIVLEENVQGLIGRPPTWRERVRFPARAGAAKPVAPVADARAAVAAGIGRPHSSRGAK